MITQIPNWLQQASTKDIYQQYMALNWVVTPVQGKSPVGSKWNQRHNCLDKNTPPLPFMGVGLCHAYSGTVAIDVDDWQRASFELMLQGINLQALYDAPDAVVIHSGRAGHGKLLYRMPFGLALNSKKLIDIGPDGNKYNYLDFRCGTANGATVQDVLPGAAIHPDTGRPYQWAGKGHFSRLPVIPAPLLNFWMGLLKKDSERRIVSGAGANASWDEIRSALGHISPDCSRPEWVDVGMALHWAGEQTGQVNEAMELWDDWSKPSPKYKGEREIIGQWNSFRTDKGNIVKLGTLYHMARENGWVRPQIDAQELFSPVDVPVIPVASAPQVELPAWLTGAQSPQQQPELPAWLMAPEQPAQPIPAAPSVIASHKAPPINFDLFPKVLARRAKEVAQNTGCDPIMPLWAGIAAVCGVADSRTRLWANDSFSEPPIIWSMIVADSGQNKTSGTSAMLDIINTIEQEDREPYKQRKSQYEVALSIYQRKKKMLLSEESLNEMTLSGEVNVPYTPEPPPPVPLTIKLIDTTSQSMLKHMASNPRGLLCHMDELSNWVKLMVDPRSGENRSAWVQGYEGKPYKTTRATSGDQVIDNHALTVIGNIQPDILDGKINTLSGDGLFQRFIPVLCDPSRERLADPTPESTWNVAEYETMIRLIHSLPKQSVRMSPEASKVFREFQEWQFNTKGDFREMGLSGGLRSTFNKMPGLALRIALVFHLIESPFSNQLSATIMNRAIRVIKEMVIPSIVHILQENEKLNNFDKWVMDHVAKEATTTDELSLGEIKRSARRQIGDMPGFAQDFKVREAMSLLASQHWVTIKEDVSNKSHVVWAINPALKSMFIQRQLAIDALSKKHKALLNGSG